MVTSSKPPKNAFVAGARKIYNPIGFSKGYNFVLWFVFVGALFGFSLSRLQYLDFWGVFCNPDAAAGNGALPGECFYYTKPGRYRVGIILHLAAVLPASLLACFQFVPAIRHRALLVHRVNGYVVVLLAVVSTAAAFVIARHAAGGGVDVQTLTGLLGIAFVGALVIAVINVKRLQIEQHRAWMIRAWSYGGVIITLRIALIIGAMVISRVGGHYYAQPCDKVNFALGGQDTTMHFYPECAPLFSGENPDQQVVTRVDYYGDNAAEVGAALNIIFGPAAWLALALHVFGAELYLRLTPAEHERLRNVSYQRQLEAGYKNPGRGGLTADRLGDAQKWTPASAAAQGGNETPKAGSLELQPLSHTRS